MQLDILFATTELGEASANTLGGASRGLSFAIDGVPAWSASILRSFSSNVPSRGTIESVRKHAHAAASALTWGVSLVYAAAATFSVRAAA